MILPDAVTPTGVPTSGSLLGTGASISFKDANTTNTRFLFSMELINFMVESSESANFGNGYFGTTAVSSAQNPDDGNGIFEYDVPAGYRALCTKSIKCRGV